MRARNVILSAAVLISTSISAQSAQTRTTQAMRHGAPMGLTESFFACVNSAGLDESKVSECISTERKGQDARLNKAYGVLMTSLDPKARDSVRAAERAWLDFNTKSVAAETAIGGSNQVANIDVSQAELFRFCERANVLESYISSIGK